MRDYIHVTDLADAHVKALSAPRTQLQNEPNLLNHFRLSTLQLAAGMTLHVFTTARGTPYGLAAVPVVKVATRSELARRWHDLMDVDAGRIATGDATIEEIGWDCSKPCSMLRVVAGAPGPRNGGCTIRWHCSIPPPSPDEASQTV